MTTKVKSRFRKTSKLLDMIDTYAEANEIIRKQYSQLELLRKQIVAELQIGLTDKDSRTVLSTKNKATLTARQNKTIIDKKGVYDLLGMNKFISIATIGINDVEDVIKHNHRNRSINEFISKKQIGNRRLLTSTNDIKIIKL